MSATNSIAREVNAGETPAVPVGFELPPALASRYKVRIVDGADGEQRIGLFRPVDRDGPSIEITNDRIVARSEDAETVAALVKIAQHSGWDRIAVDGSPEFRQAVWKAASREGLAVSGYEPSFAELEGVAQTRRETSDGHVRDLQAQTPSDERTGATGGHAPLEAVAAAASGSRGDDVERDGNDLSDGDRRLLLTLSRHTEDRKSLAEGIRPDMDAFDREVQNERLESNREALSAALDQALESPTLVAAFQRAGFEPEALRSSSKSDQWDRDIADAVYLARSGLHRDAADRETNIPAASLRDLETARDDRTPAERADGEPGPAVAREPLLLEAQSHTTPDRRRDDDELAEVFLHGPPERIAADPRLEGARQAQAAMELHIGEIFGGDASRMTSATLESRLMISDVLRRGLDVSVRESTPIRQIEPVQNRPDMER
ncbi:LPD7 domain-containing protein [Sphingomonas carotinifaciens]|uniref:Large polyvalent protein-associated domain-containing protein n=1 Tax=Sphingomonas carotinifaciens TaxID=1166323 RepID=A0A1G7Q492_9SPHN|nr:LPD7 domain-containing protein [Sphingomonas carotinifaciens]MBB4087598.1 hypothetical protein [Sphingomonas carotinifaciens]MWC45683.1 hypothetical protein [Sphingomonas carotinifaciens]SDF92440.1 hypothetical protein SAMN05216557_107170 [Sphingomonas carotinifaciens]